MNRIESYDDLRDKGFSENIIEAVNCLTRRKGEDYDAYISRVLKNSIAIVVKIADLNDHLTESKKRYMNRIDMERIRKYKKAKQRLLKE